ncbi:MAG: ribonuclease PH [Verrucomicrobia bacterium]|nr:ribonuclease PH [Verrucomicrobiota bacterium]
MRRDGRRANQPRELRLTAGIAPNAHGSVLIATGATQVICTATLEDSVPKWMKDQRVSGGWITAEYSMLPYSTLTRRSRDIARGRLDGRSTEIQRLIGRALRAAVDLDALGERTLWIDCDVLQADGGTRTAAITGASVALVLACARLREKGLLTAWPVRCLVAATSVGVIEGKILVDLDYEEDRVAAVDLNLVMTSRHEFVEVQGSGEENSFSHAQLLEMLELGRQAIASLLEQQRAFLQEHAPETGTTAEPGV